MSITDENPAWQGWRLGKSSAVICGHCALGAAALSQADSADNVGVSHGCAPVLRYSLAGKPGHAIACGPPCQPFTTALCDLMVYMGEHHRRDVMAEPGEGSPAI